MVLISCVFARGKTQLVRMTSGGSRLFFQERFAKRYPESGFTRAKHAEGIEMLSITSTAWLSRKQKSKALLRDEEVGWSRRARRLQRSTLFQQLGIDS